MAFFSTLPPDSELLSLRNRALGWTAGLLLGLVLLLSAAALPKWAGGPAALAGIGLTMAGFYWTFKAWTDWSIRAEVLGQSRAKDQQTATLRERQARWPALAAVPDPPLAQWLATDRFPRFEHVSQWGVVRPFGGQVDGLEVLGATAVLTKNTTFRSTPVRDSDIRTPQDRTDVEFDGLVLRCLGQPAPAATLQTPRRLRGLRALDDALYAGDARYGARQATGDPEFDATFALYAPGAVPHLSVTARQRIATLHERYGPMTVAWRGRERILLVDASNWERPGHGVQLLEDALAVLQALQP